MAIQQVLEKFGLTANEAKTYLALVELGTSRAGRVAQRANLHRRPTYDALHRLVSKGLVSYVVMTGKKHFRPADPARLVEIARERSREIERILPEMTERFRKTESRIHAEIYEGADGLKSVMELILKEKKEWLTIGSTGKAPAVLPYYLEQFAKKRVNLGIKRKILIADTKDGREYYKMLKKQSLTQARFLPEEIKQPQTIWIFGEKVAIILVAEQLTTFLIDSREIAHSYREYFNLLWNRI